MMHSTCLVPGTYGDPTRPGPRLLGVPGFVFVLVVVLGASSLGGFGLLCKIL